MLIPALLLAALTLSDPPAGGVFNGRAGKLDVTLPRIEASVTVDGSLSEPAWRDAALLTGFSQFQPADLRPSTDSTEVLVWYSATAIHFGIRAFSPSGAVNARLSDRDKIDADDFVQIILSTFNDGRQAFVFGVNALGVQSDGTINEGVRAAGNSLSAAAAAGNVDLSANFVYESKGRITEGGYEVEVRIPFKSLRYQTQDRQDWGIQVIRRVQHLGHDDTWTPARRDAASFLSQGGTLKGLNNLSRGLVVDLNPSVTARQVGARKTDNSWGYDPDGPEFGGTVKWGITNNLTLNGTVNPDFSQVESDVVAFQFDPRTALFYPERRPFFLEGIENFAAPNGLVYTRSIGKPDFATKLTGKAFGTNLALLQALDDRTTSLNGEGHPFFNIVRATRDVGGQSRIGLTYTDRYDHDDVNRVFGLDTRLVMRKIWSMNGAYAGSWTKTTAGASTSAPIWSASVNRAGRHYVFDASINGVDPQFQAQAGFITRSDVVNTLFANNWTFQSKSGSRVETRTFGVRLMDTWHYDAFTSGAAAQDRKLHFTGSAALRGGWRTSGGIFFETFGFDKDLYANYYLERRVGTIVDTVKFTNSQRLANIDLTFRVATPQWTRFSADVFYIGGKDENFEEWASGIIHFLTANVRYRPSDQLRFEAQLQHQEFNRRTNQTNVSVRNVPRLKVEYQATRSIFFRLVGQYDASSRDSLRDDGRTNFPFLFKQPDGSFVRATKTSRNVVRADWLFSYQPTPGTVFFLGYGSSLREDERFHFRALRRRADGFFLKWSYLFRLK